MRKLLFLFMLAVSALGLSCGGTTNTANKPASTDTAASKPAEPAPSKAAEPDKPANAEKKVKGSNADLDFTLVNSTGYAIKEVFVGPASTKEWTDEMEILNGRTMSDGASIDVKFDPKTKAANWDIKVEWADGTGSVEWLKLDLSKIAKVTLKYDKAKNKTTAEVE